MFRLLLFTTTAALVAVTATGCIEGPELPPSPIPVTTSFATTGDTGTSESGGFCDDTQVHLNCAIACERIRFCGVMQSADGDDQLPVPIGFVTNPMTDDDLGECIWTCTTAVLSGDIPTTRTTECLMESGGDCVAVHDCLGRVAPDSSPSGDEAAVEGSGFDAEAEAEVAPECATDDDCPFDAQCDEMGTCQHFSQSPVANVMQCETACDALDACGGIKSAGGSFHLCFTQCLSHSSDPEVVETVICVLSSTSCDEIVGCVEDHQSDHQSPEVEPTEEETFSFTDTDEEQEEDETAVVDVEQDEEEGPFENPENEGDDEGPDSAEEGDESDFIEDVEDEEIPAQDPTLSLIEGGSPGPGVCVAACSIILPCSPDSMPLDACIDACMSVELTAEGINKFLCLLAAGDCDGVMDCAGAPQPSAHEECLEGEVTGECGECICEEGAWICDEDGCAMEQNHEIICSFACSTIAECNGEELVDDDGFTCFERCTSDFFAPVVQDGINCVFNADSCDQVLTCVTGTPALEPQGYDDEEIFEDEPSDDDEVFEDEPSDDEEIFEDEPADDDEVFEDDPSDEPSDEPMDDEPADEDESHNDSPCFGPEPEPTMGCGDIHIERELMITDLSVVNDPTRTFDGCDGTPMGPWTFGSLMTKMAGDNDPSAFVMNWLQQWTVDQELNGFVAPSRQSIQSQVIDPWLDRSGGETLDLAQAPFRLLAIANRVDLRNTNADDPGFSAGEGRFVFGLVDPDNGCTPREFVVIFEYGQKANTLEEIQDWAHAWHALGSMEFGEEYNQALVEVTDLFAGAGMDADKPNGSSINQIRTNEVALNGPWELREFRVQADGQLAQVSVKQEPGSELRDSDELAQWINANEADVLNSTHSVPAEMLGPAAPVEGLWAPQGVNNPDARHAFGLNTCSGCHQSETGTPFLHVSNRSQSAQTQLSGFLVGGQTNDPISGDIREFNDLERRMLDLCNLVSPDATAADVVDVDPAPACAP